MSATVPTSPVNVVDELIVAMSATVNVDELIAAPAKRAPMFRIPADAKRSEYGDQYLARGTHGQSGAPHLVLVNGTKMSGFPVGAVALAILDGQFSRAEVSAILDAVEAREKLAKSSNGAASK